jgi:hypothetical protein
MYVRTEGVEDSNSDAVGISMLGSNSLATNNAIDHARTGVAWTYCGGVSNVEISFNNETFVEHGITVGDANTNCSASGVNVHDNDLGGGAYLWDTLSNSYHHDAIHIWCVHAGANLTEVKIYNNYIHGRWGSHSTAAIFMETIGAGSKIFNNVIVWTEHLNQPSNGFIFLKGSGTPTQATMNAQVYNNTLVSDNESVGIGLSSNSGHNIRNNIMSGISYGIYIPAGSSVATSDYNDFFGVINMGQSFQTFAGWQAQGFDLHSKQSDPKLDATYHLLAGSPAISSGANLTSLGIIELDADQLGAGRPGTGAGAWDFGAYVYGASQTAGPNAPRGLTAIVQ